MRQKTHRVGSHSLWCHQVKEAAGPWGLVREAGFDKSGRETRRKRLWGISAVPASRLVAAMEKQREFRASKELFVQLELFELFLLESLILAQDERWRRA